MTLTIEREKADTAEAIALLKGRDEELGSLYPPEARFGIPIEKHGGDHILFYVVRQDGAPVGCGALERHEGYGEMKSIYVTPAARGRRLAEEIVRKLEDVARSLGHDEMRLETGIRSPAAIRTYERAGYRRRERFGDYPDAPLSVLAKSLRGNTQTARTIEGDPR